MALSFRFVQPFDDFIRPGPCITRLSQRLGQLSLLERLPQFFHDIAVDAVFPQRLQRLNQERSPWRKRADLFVRPALEDD